MASILIKNGLVCDGNGTLPLKQDILIRGERIAHFGNFNKSQADKIIDASGAIVTPGFIDITSNLDQINFPFSASHQENFLENGITTAIIGNSGLSLAPISKNGLRFLRNWLGVGHININWHTTKEFLAIIERRKNLKINLGTLVGHLSLRLLIPGADTRDLTESETEFLVRALGESLDDGAFGISTGFEYSYSEGINVKEIKEFARVVASRKKIFAVDFQNKRDGVENLVNKIIGIAKNTGASFELNNFSPRKSDKKEFLESASAIEKEIAQTNINFDCGSFEYSVFPIHEFLLSWAKNSNFLKMEEEIQSEHIWKRLREHFRKFNPEEIIIYSAPNLLKPLIGKTLEGFGANSNLKPAETLLKLMKISHLRMKMAWKNIDEKTQKEFFLSPNSLVSSSGFLEKNKNFMPFFNFLKSVTESQVLPFEKALMKITSLPAQKYNIRKRGILKENHYADILILRDFTPSEIIVNGELVMENSKIIAVEPGKALKSKPEK